MWKLQSSWLDFSKAHNDSQLSALKTCRNICRHICYCVLCLNSESIVSCDSSLSKENGGSSVNGESMKHCKHCMQCKHCKQCQTSISDGIFHFFSNFICIYLMFALYGCGCFLHFSVYINIVKYLCGFLLYISVLKINLFSEFLLHFCIYNTVFMWVF